MIPFGDVSIVGWFTYDDLIIWTLALCNLIAAAGGVTITNKLIKAQGRIKQLEHQQQPQKSE